MEKIIVLCNKSPFPNIDGGTAATKSLIDGLLQAGYAIHALIFDTYKHPLKPELLFPEWENKAFSFAPISVDTHIDISKLLKNLLFEKESLHISRVQLPEVSEQIIKACEKFEPDFLVLDGLFAMAQIPDLSHLNIPMVYRAHNVESEIWEKLARESKPAKKFYLSIMAKRLKNFEKKLALYPTMVWAISPNTADFFRGLKLAVELIYPSVQLPENERIRSFPKNGHFSLFHIGAMNWQPNLEAVDYFVHAFLPELSRHFPHAVFYAGGRHFPMNRYEVSAHFKVVGEVPSYADFIRDMDALVVPLKSGSGIRMKIIETMALGIPVLSTKAGMEGIPARDGEHFLAFENASDFIQVLYRLQEDEMLYGNLAQAAKQLVATHFSPQSVSRQMKMALDKWKN